MKKVPVAAVSVILSLGMVAGVSQLAAAKGKPGDTPSSSTSSTLKPGHRPTAASPTGAPTCQVHGIFSLSASGNVSISGNITPVRGAAACTGLAAGVKIHTGHLSIQLTSTPVATTTSSTSLPASVPTTAVGCTLPSGALASLSDGRISWTPPSRFAASTGVFLSGGTLTLADHAKVSYTGGGVTSGSFTNASGASLSITSIATTATLQSSCATDGSLRFAFKGTITL